MQVAQISTRYFSWFTKIIKLFAKTMFEMFSRNDRQIFIAVGDYVLTRPHFLV